MPPPTKIDRRAAADAMTSAQGSKSKFLPKFYKCTGYVNILNLSPLSVCWRWGSQKTCLDLSVSGRLTNPGSRHFSPSGLPWHCSSRTSSAICLPLLLFPSTSPCKAIGSLPLYIRSKFANHRRFLFLIFSAIVSWAFPDFFSSTSTSDSPQPAASILHQSTGVKLPESVAP